MKHTNPVINALLQFGSLSEEVKEKLISIITVNRYEKNTGLLKPGQRVQKMYFVSSGLARVYYFHNNIEVSDYFAIDGQFIGALSGLYTGLPSKKGIHLIEPCEVYSFVYADFEKLCSESHELEHLVRKLITYGFFYEQERVEALRFFSAAERYNLLEKQYPGITARCPLKYLASYLNTTQVSISRIRAGKQ